MKSVKASKLPLLCCTLAVILLNDCNIDAQQFIAPANDEAKFGNRKGSVEIVWTYTTPDITRTVLFCGIFKEIVVFKGAGVPATIRGRFSARADAIDASTISPYKIGFKLRNLDFTDANSYFCTMSFSNDPLLYSKSYNFGIYEPPQFTRCLEDGLVSGANGARYFALREGEVLNSTCYVYGNPVPSLDCRTYDVSNIQQQALTPRTRNFTSMPLNERMLFLNVRRAVAKVRCVADGGPTGKKYSEQNVRVDHLPSAPHGIKLIASTPQSIRISWLPPQQPGYSPITYYFMELIHPNGTVTTMNYTMVFANLALDYTFTHLYGSQTYGIHISAYNSIGMGTKSTLASFQTVYFTSGSSTRTEYTISAGGIFALIVALPGGLMLLIIIAVNARKKMKEEPTYPDAYIEETVDYESPEGGMYALINKKKSLSDVNEPSSGYPFTIHQAKRNIDDEKPIFNGDTRSSEEPWSIANEKLKKEDF